MISAPDQVFVTGMLFPASFERRRGYDLDEYTHLDAPVSIPAGSTYGSSIGPIGKRWTVPSMARLSM